MAKGEIGMATASSEAGLGEIKVPRITIYFWLIKIMATTVGETAADFLNGGLGLGLAHTTLVTAAILIAALVLQFRSSRYVPWTYWLAVVLISVTGTLITDNLTDGLGVPLELSSLLFAVLLAIVFFLWHASEKTLSIHSVRTPRREAFYWLTILFTFAFGTAAGDLLSEGLGLGYLEAAAIVAALTALTYLASRIHPSAAVPAFWAAYILTRPLGASLGDYLTQPSDEGGLGWGTSGISFFFLLAIIALVVYLTKTRRDDFGASSSLEQKS